MISIPVTSWSEISTFRQCPHKHQLAYLEGWQPPSLSRPLEIGLLWHEILEYHYRGMRNEGAPQIEEIIGLLNHLGAKDPDHPNHELGGILLWMYAGYKGWAKRLDWEWSIQEVEYEFRVPLLDTGIDLIGRIDLVVKFKNHLWVLDHKAVKNLPTNKELDLDDQTPLYIWAMREAGFDVRGAILSHTRYMRLKRDMDEDERFSRDFVYRTDDELEMVAEEAAASIGMAYHASQTHPRHPDTQMCKWRCPYIDPCIGGRKEPHLEEQLLIAKGFQRKERRRLRVVKTDT